MVRAQDHVTRGFVCDGCGICCRHMGNVPQLSQLDRGDGVCVHLRGNLCDIYEHRPEVCNVDRMYVRFFSRSLSRDDYDALMTESCLELKRRFYDECETKQ